MIWSAQQDYALKDVARWLRDPSGQQVYYLAGFAGTGKTTLARHMAEGVSGLVLFAAFTGKAASVLRRKGCPEARTLHSILYDVTDADRTRLRELQALLKHLLAVEPDDADHALHIDHEISVTEDEIRNERQAVSGPRFQLNPHSILGDADLLVLDECSMIDERLGKDALSFGKPILVIGDPAQLPPIYGKGFFTGQEPNFLLTEIHRQARENVIIRAATAVREHRKIPFGEWGTFRHLPNKAVKLSEMCANMVKDGVQILCGKNRSRRKLNWSVRRSLGYREPYPEEGEALVILRNDHELGILNGVVCTAASDAKDDGDDDVMIRLDYEGEIIPMTPMDKTPFDIYRNPSLEENYNPGMNRYMIQADWGYAITVHKSQGSEWDEVLLIDDGFAKWDKALRWQWLYTGITRASETLTIVSKG